MNTKKVTFHFIILIPHRDAGNRLEEYRQTLFSGGASGAFAFPAAAPLAELVRPFSRDELKELAHNIRLLAEEKPAASGGKPGGKITNTGESAVVNAEGMSFFGPALNLSMGKEIFPVSTRDKIVQVLNPPILCAALVKPDRENSAVKENFALIKTPVISFRAAALANLAIRPLASGTFRSEVSGAPDYSYEWKISEQVWLPKAAGNLRKDA